ncbi:MAG: glycosyltransferase [Microbacteriaceae bacterium]|nr:glycosyltransferase [Microbacteriaceae bacterium]NBS61505.1 glycosyltransferase [Microbacteriaceae bacterium]
MKISYAVTVCNEFIEIQRLLNFLLKHKRQQDEIVVLLDTTKADSELISTLRLFESHNMDHMVVWPAEFQGHFANWKNKLTSFCKGDYIFQIDADEIPDENLIDILPAMLEENNEIDVFLVPRINTVEGLTAEHVAKWRWNVNNEGWVNWPDYQWRIWKNNAEITWINKVHERLAGFKTYTTMPDAKQFALYHPKTIARQEKQNAYYDTL